MPTTHVHAEIASQPETWRRAAAAVADVESRLPRKGERVAVVGCGTSWFMAQSYAVLRETAGHGLTDAFAGSEFPMTREYDRIVAISRSGTTTEVIDLMNAVSTPTVLITAVEDTPGATAADATIVLPFADEESVVQTRFATTTLVLLRAHLGEDVEAMAVDAETALTIDVTEFLDFDQVTFLGRGWTVGLAAEAALKTREAGQFWAESYPAMDYRHGPIAVAQPGRGVWTFGEEPEGLAENIESTGARRVHHDIDPLAALIVAQRYAVEMAVTRGLNPDKPRSLTRSVVLS